MAGRLNRTIRRLAAWGAVGLLVAQTAVAAPPGMGKHTDPAPSGCSVQWLADGDYFPALLAAIDHARVEISLSAFFFKTNGFAENRPDQVLAHLQDAGRRGVRVEVVFEQGPEDDNVSRDNAATAERLKQSGVRVCYDARNRTTHAKLVVIDRQVLFLGSHNLTQSALKYNREVSARIDSPALAEEALRYLHSLCP